MRTFLLVMVLSLVSRLCGAALAPARDVAFDAAVDGTKQYYMELLPADFDPAKKYDVVIGLHGHGSDRTQFALVHRGETDSFREFAAKHNLIAISPDYRAKTSWMGPKAEADMVQIIQDLKKKYQVNRVFIVGASMGGTAVLTFAALHPDLVDGVTSMNGTANHLQYEKFQDAIAESFGGPKEKIPAEYKKRSAEYWPELLTMPIAITTGGGDTIVPPDSTLRLAEVLKRLGRKVHVIHRPQGGHVTDFADGLAALEWMYDPQNPPAAAALPDALSAQPGDWAGGKPGIESTAGQAELGFRFSVQKAGKIKALRFFQAKGETGAHPLRLWDGTGKLILTATAPATAEPGWVTAPLSEPFVVKPGSEFVVSYTCSATYPATPAFFITPITRGGITGLAGLYSFTDLGEKAPDKTYRDFNYLIDVDYVSE